MLFPTLRSLVHRASQPSRRDRRQPSRRTIYRPALELLEERSCPTVSYNYTVIAKSGDLTTTGETIDSFKPEVSINAAGRVAVVANLIVSMGTGLLVGDGSGLTTRVSGPPDLNLDYGFPQLNNSNRVVVQTRGVGSPAPTSIRTYDANNPGAFHCVVRNGDFAREGGRFDAVTLGTRAEDGGVGHSCSQLGTCFCKRCQRLDQRHCSALSTRPARNGFRST